VIREYFRQISKPFRSSIASRRLSQGAAAIRAAWLGLTVSHPNGDELALFILRARNGLSGQDAFLRELGLAVVDIRDVEPIGRGEFAERHAKALSLIEILETLPFPVGQSFHCRPHPYGHEGREHVGIAAIAEECGSSIAYL
jgi:hypothetical protein